uniref:Palmdelphin n=1 Tax=Neogobius melanostomus TaxID=47308 RepID=A0A8C6SRN4_9GOBI
MEESELMKERLQAITERHHIQEVIRHKKQELDQEKVQLKHLKKKSLREQWLQDSSYHPPGSTASEQQTRALLLSIYRIEKEIEALEREESIVSKNESFILERLKAVEKSPEDIIKEVNDSFVSDSPHVAMETPNFPQSFSPTTNELLEPEAALRKTLFAMEINVNRNRRTGQSTVLSTSSICPDDLEERPGLKVYDDGRKCVYALHSLEGSDDQSSVSELSASEVEQLLKSATAHRQMTQNQNGMRQRSYGRDLSHLLHPPPHGSAYSGRLSPSSLEEEEVCWRTPGNRRNGRQVQRVTSFKLPPNNNRYTSQQLRRHQSFHSNGNGYNSYHNSHANYANHAGNRGTRCPSPHRPSSYTPASDIP